MSGIITDSWAENCINETMWASMVRETTEYILSASALENPGKALCLAIPAVKTTWFAAGNDAERRITLTLMDTLIESCIVNSVVEATRRHAECIRYIAAARLGKHSIEQLASVLGISEATASYVLDTVLYEVDFPSWRKVLELEVRTRELKRN